MEEIMHVNVPRKLMPFFERPLTQSETENLRRSVFIIWESLVFFITVGSLVFLWYHRTFWSALPILPIAVFVGYRIHRRRPRRCPCCRGDFDEYDNWREKAFHFIKIVFGGWFVHRHYWREATAHRPIPGVDDSFLILAEAELLKEDPSRFNRECHYHYRCRWCKSDYPVKLPEVKSFRGRLPTFFHW